MKKKFEIIFICLFGLFVLTVGGLTVTRNTDTYSYYENRNLVSFPECYAETVADGSYFSGVETYLSDHAFARNTMMKLKTRGDLLLGRPVVNEIVVTEEALLPYYAYDRENNTYNAAKIAENLKSVKDCTEQYGGEFYFMAVPTQSMLFQDAYPAYLNGWDQYVAQAREELFPRLQEAGVDCIDLDQIYRDLGKSDDIRSTVDHHYNLEGAYLAYRALMDRVTVETDVLTEDEFSYGELPNPTIGSRSKKIYGLTDFVEPLSYMELKTPIAFTRMNYGQPAEVTVYKWPATPWETVEYGFYMGGDFPNTVIDTGREDLPTILVYGDSFTNAFETIVYYSFDEMHTLDFRYLTGITLGEYIQVLQPDVVVCMRDYNIMMDPTGNGQGAYGTE